MKQTRIFDDDEGYSSITDLQTFTDCTVVKRENQWWMFTGGDEKMQSVPICSAPIYHLTRRFRVKQTGQSTPIHFTLNCLYIERPKKPITPEDSMYAGIISL